MTLLELITETLRTRDGIVSVIIPTQYVLDVPSDIVGIPVTTGAPSSIVRFDLGPVPGYPATRQFFHRYWPQIEGKP